MRIICSATIALLAVPFTSLACLDADPGTDDGAVVPADDRTVIVDVGVIDTQAERLALPATLSETRLYVDMTNRVIASDVRGYTPAATLWSDGAAKERYIRLPPGKTIDTSDVDAWSFPRGTMLWKQFRVDGQLVETRCMLKVGDAAGDWQLGAYVWRADGSDADYHADEVTVTLGDGQPWTVPGDACMSCHVGQPDTVIGFSAVLLDNPSAPAGSLTLSALITEQLLSSPPSSPPASATWTRESRTALLYLQANCAHCHQPGASGTEASGLDLSLRYGDADPTHTAAWATAVGEATLDTFGELSPVRIDPGHPERSALLQRMARRDWAQMPALGSSVVDDDGLAAVSAWIASLH